MEQRTVPNFGKPDGKMRDIADPKFAKSMNKPELVVVWSQSYEYIGHLMETVESYRTACSTLQAKLTQNQETHISVQQELSECKLEN
jgi:hypothetical protein